MTLFRAAAALVFLLGAGAGAAPAEAQSSGSRPGVSRGPGSITMVPMNQPRPKGDGFVGRPGRPGRSWWHGGGPRDRDETWRERWRKRCLKRGRCRGFDDGFYDDPFVYGYGYGYGGIGYDPLIAGGAYGYYTQDGGPPRVSGGRAQFDYDRGYPYEYYSGPRTGIEMSEAEPSYRPRECETETARDHRAGRDVSVRVCRN